MVALWERTVLARYILMMEECGERRDAHHDGAEGVG